MSKSERRIQDTDIAAWLGPADDEITDEQREEFTRLVHEHHAEIVTRRPRYGTDDYYPDDYAEEDAAAWVAAYEYATGILDLAARGRAFLTARTDAQQGAIIAALAGDDEAPTARAAAVSRPWLRKQLGK